MAADVGNTDGVPLAGRFLHLDGLGEQRPLAFIESPVLRIINELRLVIERVNVRGAAGQIDKDHALGFAREVRRFRSERVLFAARFLRKRM